MANICPSCGSQDVQSGIGSSLFCMTEQKRYDPDGNVLPNGPDAETVQRTAELQAHTPPPVVGNLADVQRRGADAAENLEGDALLDAGVVVPQDGAHPAEHDAARGHITRETIRTGIHSEDDLLPPDPRPGDGSNSVDPTSVSPAPVDGGQKSGKAAASAEQKAKEAKV